MGQTPTPTRHNQTITVDFHDETTSFALVANPQEGSGHHRAILYAKGSIAGERQVS
jgi:hypothetical protein